MLHKTYLKRLCIKLLSEAEKTRENPFSDDDIAFYQYDLGSSLKQGVVYTCKDLIDTMSKNTPIDEADIQRLCEKSIIGFIRINKPKYPCHGAWEVTRSAGPGHGKLVYAMGYHMSPTGKLMSDRVSVSDSAREAWTKVYKKSQGLQLDDIKNPKTPTKSDDCQVHDQIDALNKAYEMGDMGYDFNLMSNNHAKVTKFVQDKFNINEDDFNSNINNAGEAFFSIHG